MGLADHIKILKEQGELIEITTPVSTNLEITEIVDRISKSGSLNKALLFKNTGTQFPVLINMYGSNKRMALALGHNSLDETGKYIEELIKNLMNASGEKSFWEKLKILFSLKELASYMPKLTKGKAKCQQNIMQQPDLNLLPVLKLWPNDVGPFITLPIVHTKDPVTGKRNAGMYRMQIFDSKTTGMHWHMHKGGAEHFRKYKEAGIKKMPVAVALGGNPVYAYVASAPLPDDIDEYILAGILMKQSVKLVKCLTQDIEVPADADIVIEGYIDTEEEFAAEGPFGDHTGYYSLVDFFPRFHVTAITYSDNAVYPATIVGIPPQEDKYIADATGKIFLPLFKYSMLPEITDWHMPYFGVAHNLVIASVKTRFPGHAMKIAHTFWGAGQMSFNKVLVLTDSNINPADYTQLLRLIANIDTLERIKFGEGILDILDHASSHKAVGGKMLIDLTGLTPANISNFEIKRPADNLWIQESLGIAVYYTKKQESIEKLVKDILVQTENIKFAILAEEDFFDGDYKMLLWYVLANCEISRDVKRIGNVLVIDGRSTGKSNYMGKWPRPALSNESTIKKVDKRWKEYGFKEFIESPSKKLISFFDTGSAYDEADSV